MVSRIVGQEVNTIEYLSNSGNSYEVTVDLRNATNIIEGAVLKVEELSEEDSADYLEEAVEQLGVKAAAVQYAKVLDISILYNNKELQPNNTVNVEVKLLDNESKFDAEVVHFGNTTEVLDSSVDGNSVEFETSGFSVFTIVAIDHDYTEDESHAAGRYTALYNRGSQGSILANMQVDDANDWQIVSREYEGNSARYKVDQSEDGHIRAQKNVIPTENENEFLVYLSLDALMQEIATTETVTSMISIGTENLWYAGRGNGYPDIYASGDYDNTPTAGDGGGALAPSTQGNATPVTTTGNKLENVQLYMYYNGNLIAKPLLRMAVPNSVLYLKVGNQYICLKNIHIKGGQYLDADDGDSPLPHVNDAYVINVDLTEMSYNALFSSVISQNTEETSVIIGGDGTDVTITDPMGENIVYDGLESGDATASVTGNTVTWTLTPKTDPYRSEPVTEVQVGEWIDPETGDTHSTTIQTRSQWMYNVAEILYKVHLNVTADGFENNTTYYVNNGTKFNYMLNGISKSLDITEPSVKGTLYGFDFTKVDESGAPIPGVTFTLTGPENNAKVSSATYTAVSDEDGKVVFPGKANALAWGDYTLTETVPAGYSAETTSWTVDIGYTEDLKDNETIDKHTGDSETPSVFPGVWIGNGADWKIVNKKNSIDVTKAVAAFGELQLSEIDHTIYIALWDQDNHTYLRDGDQIVYKRIDVTGVTEENAAEFATVTFENVPTGRYSAWELSGAPSPGMTDAAVAASLEINAPTVIKEGDPAIEIKSIATSGPADLTTSNKGAITVTNTYAHHNGTRSAIVNKQWATNDGTSITPPAGATVDFTLYRIAETESGATLETVGTITLNGSEATPWQAVWDNLPTMDDNGYTYTYKVRETNCSEADFLPYISRTGTTPMGEDDYQTNVGGGSIWNKKQTTDVTVSKIVNGLDSDKQVPFEFTATLTEGSFGTTQNEGVTVDGSTAAFSLKDGETVTLKDVPLGAELKITEANDGTIYSTNAAGSSEAETPYDTATYTYTFNAVKNGSTVTFTNTRMQGVLRVVKNVTGDEPYGLAGHNFQFTVTGPSYPEGTTVQTTVTKSGATWTGYIDLRNVYVGEYTVQEIADSAVFVGYTGKVEPADAQTVSVTSTNTTETPATVTITNNYTQNKRDIVFTKQWNDENNKYNTRMTPETFGSSHLWLDNGIEQQHVSATPTVAVTGDSNVWSITYKNMPTHVNGQEAKYTLEEYNMGSYDGNPYKVDENGTLINTLRTKKFKVFKTDADQPTIGLPGAVFKLTGELLPGDITGTTDANGYLPGTTDIVFELPDGTYTLSETTPPEKYTGITATVLITVDTDKSHDEHEGVFVDGPATVSETPDADGAYVITIANTRKKAPISITKTVKGNMGNKADTFEFALELFSYKDGTTKLTGDDWKVPEGASAEYHETYTAPSGAAMTNVWIFTLTHDQTVTFTDLPIGTQYLITELKTDKQADYKTSFAGVEGDSMRGSVTDTDPQIAVINERNGVVPTGIRTDLMFWPLILGACFLLLFGSVAYSRRRRW